MCQWGDENTTRLCHDTKLHNRLLAYIISVFRHCKITELLPNTQLLFMWQQNRAALNWPEFEFGQSSDERAELLVLLGWKGWTLICRGGGTGRREGEEGVDVANELAIKSTTRLLCNQNPVRQFTAMTYLHQAVKDPLLVIEKQWTGWDGRFPTHMLLYTIPAKQTRDS